MWALSQPGKVQMVHVLRPLSVGISSEQRGAPQVYTPLLVDHSLVRLFALWIVLQLQIQRRKVQDMIYNMRRMVGVGESQDRGVGAALLDFAGLDGAPNSSLAARQT